MKAHSIVNLLHPYKITKKLNLIQNVVGSASLKELEEKKNKFIFFISLSPSLQ